MPVIRYARVYTQKICNKYVSSINHPTITNLMLFQVLEKDTENTKALYRRGQVCIYNVNCNIYFSLFLTGVLWYARV